MNLHLDILAWLLIPLGVTIVALFVVGWRARPKRPADAHEGMAEMVRFREAMGKPLPTGGTTAPHHGSDHHDESAREQDAGSARRGAA